MRTTLPTRGMPQRKVTPRKLSRGTIVQVKNQPGHFTVTSVAGWGGPDYAFPVRYNLHHHEGRKLVVQAAGLLVPVTEDELPGVKRMIAQLDSEAGREQWNRRYASLSERMLAAPDRTRIMARFILGQTAADTLELTELAKRLVPKYRVTHCWSCRETLNNLDFDQCQQCGGIRCKCGKCLCDSPWFRGVPW